MAGEDFDAGPRNFKMSREEFNESGVSLAVVSAGAEVDGIRAVLVLEDFFLRGTRLDVDADFHIYILYHSGIFERKMSFSYVLNF